MTSIKDTPAAVPATSEDSKPVVAKKKKGTKNVRFSEESNSVEAIPKLVKLTFTQLAQKVKKGISAENITDSFENLFRPKELLKKNDVPLFFLFSRFHDALHEVMDAIETAAKESAKSPSQYYAEFKQTFLDKLAQKEDLVVDSLEEHEFIKVQEAIRVFRDQSDVSERLDKLDSKIKKFLKQKSTTNV